MLLSCLGCSSRFPHCVSFIFLTGVYIFVIELLGYKGASVRGRVDGHRESGSHWLLKTTCNCHPCFQLPLLCVCPHNWTGKYLILQSPQYLRRVALLSLFACKLSVDPFHFCPGNIFFCCNYYLFILNRISDLVVVLF